MYSNVVLYKYIHCDTGSYIKHKNDCRAKNVAEKYITRQTNKKEKKKKKQSTQSQIISRINLQ